METKTAVKKFKQGHVVSNKMEKTVVVAIVTKVKDKSYGKYVKKTHKFFAHDAKNVCQIGDIVEIMETRPMSKNKNWIVSKIVAKSIAE